jgi:hypothetical protein
MVHKYMVLLTDTFSCGVQYKYFSCVLDVLSVGPYFSRNDYGINDFIAAESIYKWGEGGGEGELTSYRA